MATPLETKQTNIIKAFANNMDTLVSVLPAQVTPEKLLRILSAEIRGNTSLAECTTVSLMGSVIKSCLLGLELGNAKGHAYLVPFKKEATLIVGYRGFVWMAHGSKLVTKIEARAVFEGDKFWYGYGTDPRIEHEPRDAADRTLYTKLTHVYCMAKFTSGEIQFDVMTKGEVERIKGKSPSAGASQSPWKSDPIEMAKKTVIRRLAKLLPMSEIQEAAALDEMVDSGHRQGLGDFLEGEFNIVDEAKGAGDKTPAKPRGNTAGKQAIKDKEKKQALEQKQADASEPGEPTLFEQKSIALKECQSAADVAIFIKGLETTAGLSDDDRTQLERLAHAALERAKQSNQ